jgi:hypothetical protein
LQKKFVLVLKTRSRVPRPHGHKAKIKYIFICTSYWGKYIFIFTSYWGIYHVHRCLQMNKVQYSQTFMHFYRPSQTFRYPLVRLSDHMSIGGEDRNPVSGLEPSRTPPSPLTRSENLTKFGDTTCVVVSKWLGESKHQSSREVPRPSSP